MTTQTQTERASGATALSSAALALAFHREPLPAAVPADVRGMIEEGRRAEHLGRHSTARRCYEGARDMLAHKSAWAPATATVIRWIGDVHRSEGDGEAALECYEASRALAESTGERAGVARAQAAIGSIEQLWGRLDSAERVYNEARTTAEAAADARLLGSVEHNLSQIARTRGDLTRALYLARLSLSRFRSLNYQEGVARVLANLGGVRATLEHWAEAEECFAESARLSEVVGDAVTRVRVELARTDMYLRREDPARARESCDAAFELANRFDQRLALGEVFRSYGVIFRKMEKYALAETHLYSATERAELYSNPLLAGESQRELAEVYRRQGRNREALNALSYAHRVFGELSAANDVAEVNRRMKELEDVYLEIMRRWGEEIESNDRYTAGHCDRVADLSCMLARAVGFDDHSVTWLRMGAFLHDVGKTAVPAEILNKEDRLTPDEWAIMRRHPVAGVELLAEVEFPWDVRPLVRSHHERWDGGGYPDGLKEKAIPLTARILCIADVYDALTSTRSYRHAHTPREALRIMRADSGRIFDPDLYTTFERLLDTRLDAGMTAR